jgi:hypothetical protein
MSVIFHFKVSIQEKGKDRQIHVEKSSFVIGRGKDADIVISDDLISREQIRVSHSLGNIWMEELGSSNGTWLDGKKLPANQKMIYRAGQIVSLGGRSGPMLALECTVNEDVISASKAQTTEHWMPEKKVVNGPIQVAAPVRRSPPPIASIPIPEVAPVREKLTVIQSLPEMEPEEKIIRIKSQAEENLFEHIRKLVGTEAEAIREACLEEAKKVKKNAEDFASQQLQAARVEAEQIISEAEAHVSHKINELRGFESDAQRKLFEAKSDFNKAREELAQIKESESIYRQTLKQLQQTIETEEARIQFEMDRLNSEREQFDVEARELDERIQHAASEERRLKADLEAEMNQIYFKMNQVKTEIEKSEAIKESLGPQVDLLSKDKNLLENKINDLKLDHEKESGLLKLLALEYDEAQKGLERSRIEFEVTSKNLEIQRKEIHKSRDEVEILHKSATETLANAQQESRAKLESAQQESKAMLESAQKEVQFLNEQKERLKIELDLERTQNLASLKDELDRAKAENEKSVIKLQDKKTNLIKDIEKMAVTGHEEFHKIINQAKAEATELKHNSLNDAATLKLVSETEAKRLKEEAGKVLEKAEAESKSRLKKLRLDLQIEKDALKQELAQLEMRKHSMEEDVLEARRKREDLLDGARDKVREALALAETEALNLKKQILDAAKIEAKELMIQADNLSKDEKAKLVIQLAETKHFEMAKIKEMRAQSEEEWSHRRIERSRSVSTNLYALVASEMYKSRNRPMDDAFIESFSKEFKELVVNTMLDRVGPDTNKLQSMLKNGADAKTKEIRFWRKVKIAGLSTAALLALLIFFPQVITAPKNIIVAAFTEKKENSGSDVFLKKLQQSRVKAIYAPKTTAEFKSSYVENILYTTDFATRVQDTTYQDKWILDLNDWFIRSLDVKDTTIIKFVSLESNLLRDLEKMKADINPANIAPSLELMNNRESEYRQKLSEIFGDPAKVERYYEYSAKFWNDFYNPRKPAAN